METSGFPHFTIQANSSLLEAGDTLVIKCLISNITLLTLVNSYSINWLKDEVQITNSFYDVINDARFSVQMNVANQKRNVMSELQIKSIADEDEGYFTCELIDRRNIKRRKSIFILIDDMDVTLGVNMTGNDATNVTGSGNNASQTPFDVENVTSKMKVDPNKINTAVAMGNITDQYIINITGITDIKSVKMKYSIMPEEITTYGQTTFFQVETAPRPRQDSTGIIIGICVPLFVLALIASIMLIAKTVKRHRQIKKRLHHPGPNYARQQLSNYEYVDFEMEEPVPNTGASEGYKNEDTIENIGHLIQTERKNYLKASDETFLYEYTSRHNTDMHAGCSKDIRDQTSDFEEASGAANGDRPDIDQSTDYTYDRVERRSLKNHERLSKGTKPVSRGYASFSITSREPNDIQDGKKRSRKHQYEKCSKNILEEYK